MTFIDKMIELGKTKDEVFKSLETLRKAYKVTPSNFILVCFYYLVKPPQSEQKKAPIIDMEKFRKDFVAAGLLLD